MEYFLDRFGRISDMVCNLRKKISFVINATVLGIAIMQSPVLGADDLIDRARQIREVASQKREAEVRQAISDATRVARFSPARAAENLKPVLMAVEDDGNLPSEKRTALSSMLRTQIRIYDKNANLPVNRDLTSLESQANKSERQQVADKKSQDDEKLSRNLDSIRNLRRDGQVEEANRRFDEIARLYPENPAVKAMGRMGRVQDNIAAESKLRSQRSDMNLALQREILRSSIPVTGDISFPEDWVERSKRRSGGAKISEEDRKTLKTLSSPLTFTLKNEPFQSFLDVMERQFGSPLIVDQQALAQINVTLETPISVNSRGWSTRTVLRKVLADLGLSYIIKNGSVQITTPDRARETVTTRAYPIGDVINSVNFMLPGYYNEVAFMQSVNNIISSIKALDPKSWEPEGSGSIVFEPSTMSLIIRQTAEFHYMMGSGGR